MKLSTIAFICLLLLAGCSEDNSNNPTKSSVKGVTETSPQISKQQKAPPAVPEI